MIDCDCPFCIAARSPFKCNPDEKFRSYQRLAAQGDIEAEAKVLQLRVRAGELDRHHVELAAYLGDEVSLMLFPDPPGPPEPYVESEVAWALNNVELEHESLVTLAVDFAEHVLPIWELDHPDNDRPANAIQTAKDWVNGLVTSIARTSYAADSAAYASHSADSAAYAAAAAAIAANACRDPATAASAAALAAYYAIKLYIEKEDQEAEKEWQKQRLIEMLLAQPMNRRSSAKSPLSRRFNPRRPRDAKNNGYGDM
jgi:predicted PhzF superfamily epimerase YddE/YHI9